MITLKKLGTNIDIIRPYIKQYGGIFNDLTLGTRHMWGDEFGIEYAIFENTLIMRETYSEHSSFYYPVGNNVGGAVSQIEEFCKKSGIAKLTFRCLTEKRAQELSERYTGAKINYLRDWSDYVYPAEQFKTYAGKKLSGQRNHVNRFKKLYPDYRVNFITEKDLPRIKEFLKEYEGENVLEGWAKEEEPRVYDLLDNKEYLGQFGIFITVKDKIVSLSIGEIVGETLFVHVEKGLKEYEGVYPLTAQEFAKAFAGEGVKFINREEDCGDLGLRTSKTQYHPSEIKHKYYIMTNLSFSCITPPVDIKTERLEITDIFEKDKDAYAKLYTDDKINEFYGYDYREDCKGEPTEEYFYNFQKDLKTTEGEYSFAVKKDGALIGEVVAYNFGFDGSCEIGYRFLKEFWGKGYAFESVSAFIAELKTAGVRIINARTKKENVRSERLLNKLGLKKSGEDSEYFYYGLAYRENANG